MLNANNKVHYEPSIKQKEKKYSLSTVLAWLYLKTIGRILPGRWNQWAESILHHNKVIVDNGVQTEIMSKNKTTQTKYDKIEGKNFQASSEFEGKKELEDKNKELNEELKGVSQVLEVFIGLCNNQAQQIEDLYQLSLLMNQIRSIAELFNRGRGKRGNKFTQSALKQNNCIVDFIAQNVLFYI